VSGRPSPRGIAALVAALALAASAFGGLVLPRLADASLPASMTPPPAKVSPAKQKVDDGRCREHLLRRENQLQLRLYRPDGALPPGV
jgi:hypothetical protein